jgi:hypothetical protein
MSSVHQSKPLVVEITDTEVTNQSGTSGKTGKDYSINKQEGWAYIGGAPYPQRIEITLQDNQPAFPVGKYSLDLNKAAFVGGFNQLGLDGRKMKFNPILATEKQA